jgi:hypothetical protein
MVRIIIAQIFAPTSIFAAPMLPPAFPVSMLCHAEITKRAEAS